VKRCSTTAGAGMARVLLPIGMLLLFATSGGPAWAEVMPLRSFAALMEALLGGHSVKVVAHYGKCEMTVDGQKKKAPEAIGGLTIEAFEYFAAQSIRNPKAFVVFSAAHLINHKGYIYNYGKFRVFEDGRVEILAQYAKPVTYRVIMEQTFTTVINNGINDGGVFFFRQK
jgi:hypothetical protein